MEAQEREIKRARGVRYEYGQNVENVQNWVNSADQKLADKSLEPQILKDYLQVKRKNP